MAKQIIWSQRSQDDRRQILEYWRKRNKSNAYSRVLDKGFREALNLIREYPRIGKPTDDKQARIKIVRDYFLIYEETDEAIILLTIWDCRQDPKGLEKII